jgi:VWFA-related protein
MSRTTLAALAVTLAVSTHVASQAPPKTEPSQSPATSPPQATFKAGVELVRLDVRVVDDQGLPVKDLRADEVQVFEGETRRPVVLFQHVAAPAGSYLEAARRTIGAEVSTNQGSPQGHLYVFVFDQNHISPGNEARARQAVDRFLHTRVKPGDRVALYALPGPGPQVPFTSNVALVLAELPKIRGSLNREGFTPIGDMTDYEAYQVAQGNDQILQRILAQASAVADPGTDVGATSSGALGSKALSTTIDASPTAIEVAKSAATMIVMGDDTESHSFLVALSDVVRQLAAIEGRKSVILVSEGFFADHLSSDIDRVASAAAEAYAVIYSLDINQRGVDISTDTPTGPDAAAEVQARLEALGTLAADTSGELVLDASGRGDQVLNSIASASQDYYIVGFEPPPSALGDRSRYRQVKVKVTRRGVRVEARTGYALRDPVTPADRRRAIDRALGAPFPQQGLPLEMTTYVLHGTSPGAQRVVMSLRAELPVATDANLKPADVVFVVRDARDGRLAASGSDILPLPRTADPGRTTARGVFRVQFDVAAGEYLMRVAVREPGGATGTVDRRFEVRPLDGVDITASDLIVGRRSDALPVRATGYVDEGITGMLEVYARRASDLDAVDVTIDLVPVDGETAVRSVRADLLAPRPVGGGVGRPAQAAIPLNGVPPGDYVARARVRARGETVAELMRQVEVDGGPPPVTAAPPAPAPVTPQMILAGELARRFVSTLARSGTDPSIKLAAEQAEVGAWSKVIPLLGRSTGEQSAGSEALRGLALFADDRFDQAAGALSAALALEPTSAATAFLLGWVETSAGNLPEAITAWRDAVHIDPTMTSAYLALAETYLHLSHPELAAEALGDGLRALPKSVELQAKLAEIERK